MLKALDSNMKSVFAFKSEKDDEYICPVCKSKVVLKKGAVKIPHFAHYVETDCPNRKNESLQHMLMKMNLAKHVKNYGLEVSPIPQHGVSFYEIDMEVPLVENRRADLVAKNKLDSSSKIVFECQVSPISYDELRYRTADYYREGYRIVWIFHISRLKVNSFYGNKEAVRIPDEIIKIYRNNFPPIFFMDDFGSIRKVEFYWKYNTETMAFINFSKIQLNELITNLR